jgi:hypothetical protein
VVIILVVTVNVVKGNRFPPEAASYHLTPWCVPAFTLNVTDPGPHLVTTGFKAIGAGGGAYRVTVWEVEIMQGTVMVCVIV